MSFFESDVPGEYFLNDLSEHFPVRTPDAQSSQLPSAALLLSVIPRIFNRIGQNPFLANFGGIILPTRRVFTPHTHAPLGVFKRR